MYCICTSALSFLLLCYIFTLCTLAVARDLHNNDFDYLPIPKGGWPELRYLYLYGIPSLYRAPVPNDCPKLQGAVFTYVTVSAKTGLVRTW